jgi:methylmalonyl-CoA mutase N-terminal domain/subunit
MERDDGEVDKVLEKLRGEAEGNENLMPPIIRAVKAYATLGEICNILREVFGEYQELIVV